MTRILLRPLLLAGLVACQATVVMGAAADRPVIAPAPAWVVMHAPAAVLPTDGTAEGAAPVRLLLNDQQIRFEGGKTLNYQEIAYRIQTPQGLGTGVVNLTWNPDTEVLNVHKLLIRRGDKVIDVLAAGQQFTVIRREQNLDVAMLNGELTANLQPEGLQVGDVINYAVTITRSDPVLKGHYETIAGDVGPVPIGLLSLGASWPAAGPMHWRAHGDLPPIKKVLHAGFAAVALQMTDVQPLTAPKLAPPRFTPGRYVTFSDFSSWAELSALFAPLYVQAARLAPGSPLHAEVAKIAAASPDPKLRAAAALKLVQDRVRYVFIGMGEAGLVPADADATWSRRFGDCKGKTALLLALLGELGIQAQPALANIQGSDGLDAELPLAARFNHVLVRATIAGRVYWLDGTQSGDSDIDAIDPPGFGWVLPVQGAHAALERIVQLPLDRPQVERLLTLDASAGLSLPAPAHAEEVIHGRAAVQVHDRMGAVAVAILDEGMRTSWRQQYPTIEVTSVSQAYDPAKRVLRLMMDGTARMDWRERRYETDHTEVGYEADFARAPGPDATAPYAVPFPNYARMTETIRLPNHGQGFAMTTDAAVDQTLGGIQWRRVAGIADGVATISVSSRSIAPEFPAADAPAVQLALREMANRAVYIVQRNAYVPTPQEVAVMLAKPPVTAGDYGQRGAALLAAARYAEAVAAFSGALDKDGLHQPQAAWVLAQRGTAQDALGHAALAAQDFAAARAGAVAQASPAPILNAICWRKVTLPQVSASVLASALADCDAGLKAMPQAFQIMDSRALVLLRLGRYDDAIDQYGRALALDGKMAPSLYGRALAERQLGRVAAHDRDLAAALAIDPAIATTFAGFGVKGDAASTTPAPPAPPSVKAPPHG